MTDLLTFLAFKSPISASRLSQLCHTPRTTLIECLDYLIGLKMVQNYHPISFHRGRPVTLYFLIPPSIQLVSKLIPFVIPTPIPPPPAPSPAQGAHTLRRTLAEPQPLTHNRPCYTPALMKVPQPEASEYFFVCRGCFTIIPSRKYLPIPQRRCAQCLA